MAPSIAPRNSTLILGLLAGISASSTAALFIRFAQNEGVPSIVIAAARLTIASLILAPIAITKYRTDLQRLSRFEWLLALFSGLFLALHFAFWITSLQFTTVASSVVLVSTSPIWVGLLAPLVLRERVGRITVFGLILALSGGVIIAFSDTCSWQQASISCPPLSTFFGRETISGDFLALCGAWMAAGYLLLGRRLRSRMELIPYIFVVYGMASVTLLALMLFQGDSLIGFPKLAYLWFALLALVPQLFGHTTFNWALKYLPASFVSVTLLGEPIGSTLLAYFIFQEVPGIIKIVGSVFILTGILLASRGEK
jgi:drug/metabolite transporter (DMT)-like permease